MRTALLWFGQPLLFVALHVLGVAVGVAVGPRDRPHLCGALGFPIGLAVGVAIELACLIAGVPFGPVTAAIALAAAIAGCAAVVRRRGPLGPATWRVLGAWTAGAAIVAIGTTRINLSIMSYDSHYLAMMGTIIAHDGGLAPGVLGRLGDYGVFTVIAQSMVGLTADSYLWGLPPTLAASTIAVFAVLLDHGLAALGVAGRGRRVLVALVTLATFSSFMLIRHAFYIQTNLGTACYLLITCALLWWAEVTGEAAALPLAFIAVFALALHRIEGPAVAVLFLALIVPRSRLPARAILVPLAVASAGVAAWYLVLAHGVSNDSEFLTPNKCYLMAAFPLAFTAYVALSRSGRLPWLATIDRWMPALIAGVIVLALVGAFATHYDLMHDSATAWLTCLRDAPYWRPTWLVIGALALLGLFVPAPPERWIFACGIPAYFAVILLLVLGRTPYYFGMGDSASRMAIHLVPLAYFYLGVKLIPAGRR